MNEALNTSTLRPGLLVSLKTSVRGNVKYVKRTLERESVGKDGSKRAKWETVRTIIDPQEHEEATEARYQANHLIRRECIWSAFGWMCPEDKAEELQKAINESREITSAFNAKAKLSRVNVYVLVGKIAQDDVEAVKAINSEVRDLLADMQKGVENLDVKLIRDASNKARGIGQMLSPDAQAKVQIAVDLARKEAKRIVKAGEQASLEIDKTILRRLSEQRTAFLDLDDANEVRTPTRKGSRSIDLEAAK